eukprot:gnl/TRDRNA2_/TRDRNA2_181400_c0_seq1.p1 gnl/TRDRNA2_/TRDRNA2_181400_c0~~gnl/TRDRNA2_/TRDRNA2_181400_c0_seq1.p1  ORF type:complete len:369 (-),score=22.86 gnl/TRDRNA2_/TRDRNA2_181400_c0_seq1:150-1169(-)
MGRPGSMGRSMDRHSTLGRASSVGRSGTMGPMAVANTSPAGAHSGASNFYLDGAMPFSGLVGHTVNKSWPQSYSDKTVAAHLDVGDQDLEAQPRACFSPHMTGSMPRQGVPRQVANIPGYTGHVARKVAENVHGGTHRHENELAVHPVRPRDSTLRRSMSMPDFNASGSKTFTEGLRVSSRVPGYMGNVPGKMSETIHACRFGDSNENAQDLRRKNPFISSDGWMRRSVWPCDRMPTYNWQCRFVGQDSSHMFSKDQTEEAYAANRAMGHTFGLKPPQSNPYKPGDRYLHALTGKDAGRLDPATMAAAGMSTYNPILDQQRWLVHNTLTLGNGNQRNAY